MVPEQGLYVLALNIKIGIENKTRTEKGNFGIETLVLKNIVLALNNKTQPITNNLPFNKMLHTFFDHVPAILSSYRHCFGSKEKYISKASETKHKYYKAY